MYMKKINKIAWFINLSLFAFVVFLGIEQAGMGAEIAKLENSLEKSSVTKQKLTDIIFASNNSYGNEESLLSLGFTKPANVYYFNTEDSFAKLPVR